MAGDRDRGWGLRYGTARLVKGHVLLLFDFYREDPEPQIIAKLKCRAVFTGVQCKFLCVLFQFMYCSIIYINLPLPITTDYQEAVSE